MITRSRQGFSRAGALEPSVMETGKSVAVWDLAPDDLGPPNQFQAWSTRADELIAAVPGRYRLVAPDEAPPTERSDGKQIVSGDGA
jgi:hypothetical protein